MREFRFFAAGTPAPQGSKRYVGGVRMVESSKALKPWRQSVVNAAVQALSERGDPEPMDGPLYVHLKFRMPRGKTVRRAEPSVAPDLDKLTRAVLDALTIAKVIVDDSRVVALRARKEYTEFDNPGVVVRVEVFDGEES